MKEGSIVNSLLANVYDLVGKKHLGKVKKLKVQVGPLSKVNPALFRNHYLKKVTNTVLEKVPLDIALSTIEITCYDCRKTFIVDKNENEKCPVCSSNNIIQTAGADIYLEEIELAS